MRYRRLKQFGITFLIVLSLFVSSVSAVCACSNHQEKPKTEKISCHSDSSMTGMEMPDGNSKENFSAAVSKAECSCIQPAAKVFAKNETLKVEKQQAIISSVYRFEIKTIIPATNFKAAYFDPPFYLSDSFYNLSPGRAPPRL